MIPAADGETGLQLLYEHNPDVVVPRRNGIVVLQETRRVSDVPDFVAGDLTMNFQTRQVTKGTERGLGYRFVKPR